MNTGPQPPTPEPLPATPPEPVPEEERVTEESLALAFWPLWVLPFAAVGLAFLLAAYFPDDVADFYMGKVIPFGITFWMGTFFTYGWEIQRLWIQELPRKWAPWVVGAALLVVLFMMGGPAAIVDDPWLAGMVVFPGVRMLMAYQKRHPGRHV